MPRSQCGGYWGFGAILPGTTNAVSDIEWRWDALKSEIINMRINHLR